VLTISIKTFLKSFLSNFTTWHPKCRVSLQCNNSYYTYMFQTKQSTCTYGLRHIWQLKRQCLGRICSGFHLRQGWRRTRVQRRVCHGTLQPRHWQSRSEKLPGLPLCCLKKKVTHMERIKFLIAIWLTCKFFSIKSL